MKRNMFDYIMETSQVMQANITARKKLTSKFVNLVRKHSAGGILTIVASGSSFHGASCAIEYLKRYIPVSIELLTPFEYEHYSVHKAGRCCLFISQSGSSTNTLRAVRHAKENGELSILLTGNVHSAIAVEADYAIDYGVGEETTGYVSKGVVTLILYLMLCALEYKCMESIDFANSSEYEDAINQLSISARNHRKACDVAKELCEIHSCNFVRMQKVFVLGCGSNMGTAREGALKLSEMVHVQTTALEVEEFIHGPDLQLTPDYTLFFIDGGDDAGKRIREVYSASRVVTKQSYLLSAEIFERTDEVFTPLYIMPVFHYIACCTAKQAGIRGEHPLHDSFEEIIQSKVNGYTEDEPF